MARTRPLVGLAFALTLAALVAPREASADFTYVALGDSLAFGETDFTHNPSNGLRGYVAPFSYRLGLLNGGVAPTTINLAVDGETTSSFTSGVGNNFGPGANLLNTNYTAAATTQDALLRSTAAAHDINYVTISLGANDLYSLVSDPNFFNLSAADQQAKVLVTLGGVQANYTNILTELHTIAPNAHVVLLGYYNPFAALTGTPIAAISAPAVLGLNQVIAGEAQAFDASYVDTHTPFLGKEATDTYILTQVGGYPNIHPTDAGYQLIVGQLSAVPEPTSVALMGIGLAGLGGLALRRRRAA